MSTASQSISLAPIFISFYPSVYAYISKQVFLPSGIQTKILHASVIPMHSTYHARLCIPDNRNLSNIIIIIIIIIIIGVATI